MRIVKINKRSADIPESPSEALELLENALGADHDRRGGNMHKLSAAARAAYMLRRSDVPAPDATTALVYLLQDFCRERGNAKIAATPAKKPRELASLEIE
jgi:hypothetical protein